VLFFQETGNHDDCQPGCRTPGQVPPGLDAIVTCEILKANQATSRIPVIILTAEESVELNQMAFEAGAQATMLKSMSHDRLMNIVDVFIQTGTSSGSASPS